MNTATRRRPILPSELYKPSLLGTTAFLLYAACLYVVPAVLLHVVATEVSGLVLKVALMVPLTIIAAYGLNLIGFVGHEGMHLCLFRNKYVSAMIGLFYASSIVSYFELGFAMQHWNHHRYTNQASDPDIALVRRFKKWWTRLLFSRWIYNWEYFKNTLRTALGYPNPFRYKMPFKTSELRVLAMLNLALAAFWIAVYAAITIYNPITGLVSIILPMITVLFIASCQTYIDHAGTNDELFRNAWSRTSPFMTAVYFGANYHLEHHLYPGVPCYRLPKVHKLLKENGTYDQEKPPIEPSFLRSYRNLASSYEPGKLDSDFNPFTVATASHGKLEDSTSEARGAP